MRVISVQPQIDNRERDLELDAREVEARLQPDEDLGERLERARQLEPKPGEACRDCWYRGRDAVIEALTPAITAPDELQQRMAEARRAEPHRGRHWIDCFNRGRDAAIETIEAA